MSLNPLAAGQPALFESQDVLVEYHEEILERAVRNVLSTDAAELVYAQIVDGLPLQNVYNDVFPDNPEHPVNALAHTEICSGSREKAQQFRRDFALSKLQFQERALNGFQEAAKDSDQFKLRLIELVVVACHQIGAYLYQLDQGTHPHSMYEEWERKASVERGKSRRYPWSPPIAFSHCAYQNWKIFPRGAGDVAGYWTEGQLFGGVILFDRGESEEEEQLDALVSFLLANPDSQELPEFPLPIKATTANRPRWDPHKAFWDYYIFRDRYERSMRPPQPHHPRDVFDARDWPELNDNNIILKSCFEDVVEQELEQAQQNVWNITPTSPLWARYASMKAAQERLDDEDPEGVSDSPHVI